LIVKKYFYFKKFLGGVRTQDSWTPQLRPYVYIPARWLYLILITVCCNLQTILTHTKDSWFCPPGFWSGRIWRKTCENISGYKDRRNSPRRGNTAADFDYWTRPRTRRLQPRPQRPTPRRSVRWRMMKSFPGGYDILLYYNITI